MTPEEKVINTRLRCEASETLRTAEHAAHKYAANCDVGPERIRAFQVFENIRNASRIDT